MSTSDPEVITYMADDDFDLPRWSNSTHSSHLGAQPSHPNGGHYSLYGQAAPPPQQPPSHHDHTRLTSIGQQQPPSSSRHPARLPHLLDNEAHPPSQDQGSSIMHVARSTSMNTGARGRRQPDDLERAYSSDVQTPASSGAGGRQQINPFYPSSVAYQQAASPALASHPSPSVDGYMYYGSSTTPRRSQTHERVTPPASAQSPQVMSSLDTYVQPQQHSTMYSSANYTDYVTPTQHPSTNPAFPSQVKTEPTEPDVRSSPYIPQHPQAPAMPTQPSANLSYSTNPSYPSMDTQVSQPQLNVSSPSRPASHSTPNTPFSHSHGQITQQYYAAPTSDQMNVESLPRRRSVGFKRVRDAKDLRPYLNPTASGRRMDLEGIYLSPLRALTTHITATYNLCNPQFRYESAHNPRRVLTKPSKPAHNEGYDNEDYDYILYVNDWLGSEEGQKYLILDVLGQGTFGQVVKCQNSKTNEILAVKVIKNKPAYFNQSMMEVTILQMLNNEFDPHDEHHILRLRDSFIHKNHLCLVFEQLSSNLYELIKQNQFQGLSTQLVKVFTAQLLDALTVLKEARLIHCDLKPENILLKSLQSPQIKVIDFGSACHERQTVYTYIQSRFYRSPEVLLGIPYTAAIDMWSLGCIAVELFLGLPLFPGTSEYNQITRIVELLGLPPQHMLDHGKQVSQFFDCYMDTYGQKKYRLKPIEQYSRERNTQEQVGKQYFSHKTLPDIIRNAPLASSRHSSSARHGQELEREANNRAAFIDFCQGLLSLNPLERWTPQQAKQHPFITGEKFTRPFNPTGQQSSTVSGVTPSPAASVGDPKRPYGGLLPSQPKGGRAYQDAASYNQQLAQHQAYTAQAQAASQASATAMRNPYVTPATQTYNDANADYVAQQQQQQHTMSSSHLTQPSSGTRALNHQASAGSLTLQYGNQGSSGLPVPATNPNPPSSSYFPTSRARANTINQMDVVPPALARLSQMGGADATGIGRNALTPVMQREDAMREWERRQSGKAHPPAQTYPQLEYLQQQAELAVSSGLGWTQPGSSAHRYAPSNLSYQTQPSALGDQDRNTTTMRDAVMSSVRSAARQDPSNSLAQAGVISTPPQAYSNTSTAPGNRYASSYQAPSSYEASGFDGRTESSSLYMPVQPQQYQSYGNAAASPSHGTQQNMSSRHNIAPPAAATATSSSFYGGGVVTTGQTFSGQASPNPTQGLSKDARRISGMDVWQR